MNQLPIRTNNKIVLCMNCFVVVPYRPISINLKTGSMSNIAGQIFCNEWCQKQKEVQEEKRMVDNLSGLELSFYYLNKNMIDLAYSQGIKPYFFSYFIFSNHELVGVAAYFKDELETIGNHESNTYDAWCRKIEKEIELPEFDFKKEYNGQKMRDEGFLSYLQDNFGIKNERQIAEAIYTITNLEGWNVPTAVFDTL